MKLKSSIDYSEINDVRLGARLVQFLCEIDVLSQEVSDDTFEYILTYEFCPDCENGTSDCRCDPEATYAWRYEPEIYEDR